jgi:hypothetical protein
MSERKVRQWLGSLKVDTNMHHDDRGGRPSVVNDKLVEKVSNTIYESRQFTVSELLTCSPQISRKLLYEVVADRLLYHKVCARWVPKLLTMNTKSSA